MSISWYFDDIDFSLIMGVGAMTSSGCDVTIGDLEKRYPAVFETLGSILTHPTIKFKVTRFA